MTERWYRTAGPEERLTQGDLVVHCPILTWRPGPLQVDLASGTEVLRQMTDAFEADVVVMTQACDLEHEKVTNVVLCPHLPLAEYQSAWEDDQRSRQQNPTVKAWRNHCEDICDGYVWNLSILNAEDVDDLIVEHRIVDFHDVFTVPRETLESLLRGRNRRRPQLLPPYREYLSQAFARYFMRVGLPLPITIAW